MDIQVISDGSSQSNSMLDYVKSEVNKIPWPSLLPEDRPPLVTVSVNRPTRKSRKHDIWFCSHEAVAETESCKKTYDGEDWVSD